MAIAFGREFRIFDLNTASGPQRPASDLGAKAGEDEHLCVIKAKLDIGDFANAATAIVDGGAPFEILQVPYSDGVLVGNQDAIRGVRSTSLRRPSEAEKSGVIVRDIDRADSFEDGSSTDIEAIAI